jgi:hypothetical protein
LSANVHVGFSWSEYMNKYTKCGMFSWRGQKLTCLWSKYQRRPGSTVPGNTGQILLTICVRQAAGIVWAAKVFTKHLQNIRIAKNMAGYCTKCANPTHANWVRGWGRGWLITQLVWPLTNCHAPYQPRSQIATRRITRAHKLPRAISPALTNCHLPYHPRSQIATRHITRAHKLPRAISPALTNCHAPYHPHSQIATHLYHPPAPSEMHLFWLLWIWLSCLKRTPSKRSPL